MARKAGAPVEAARVCCDRCPGATPASTRHLARRRLLKAAVFRPPAGQAAALRPQHSAAVPGAGHRPVSGGQAGPGDLANSTVRGGPIASAELVARAESVQAEAPPANLYRAVTGQIIDVSPQVIVIGEEGAERRIVLVAEATAWRGAPLDPAALGVGDEAVIRLLPGRPGVADRIWANIGRVTGTIVVRDEDRLVVAEGSTKPLQTVIIPARSRIKISVRFPTLQPGYLVDIIGIRHRDYLEGLQPATPQPNYRGDLVPRDRQGSGRLPETINGSATWHDAAYEPYGVLGVFYPAIDPSAGCLEDATAGFGPGEAPAFRDLPYLAVGTALNVRNECTGISWTLPVTGCAPIARLFNDRCIACQNSARGRVADLTLASFVALGGELEAGCFNATLTIGR
jgi:hypothetical protein